MRCWERNGAWQGGGRGISMAQAELWLGDGVRGRRGVGGDAGGAMGRGRVMEGDFDGAGGAAVG